VPSVIRSNITDILAALAARLVAAGVVPSAAFCYAVDHDDPELTAGKRLALLRPRGETPVRGVQEAAGRVDRRVRRRLSVLAYTQFNLDQSGRAAAALTDATYGHLALEDAIPRRPGHVPAGRRRGQRPDLRAAGLAGPVRQPPRRGGGLEPQRARLRRALRARPGSGAAMSGGDDDDFTGVRGWLAWPATALFVLAAALVDLLLGLFGC
jgi:hypothetical protein